MVELVHKYALGVSYKKVLTIEVNFVQPIADQTRNNTDIVCPTYLRQHIFSVAALDNLDHNPTSHTANSSFHRTGIYMFHFPSLQKPGLDLECLRMNSQKARAGISKHIMPLSYTFGPHVGRNPIIQPPVKDVQSVGTNSIYEEKQYKQAWIMAVHDTQCMDSDTKRNTPAM